MHRQPTQIHANFQSVCIMTFQKLDNIVELLRSVGSKECLDDDRLAFTKQDWINRRGKEFWKHITEEFSRSDLEDLFRGLVIAERELNWMGGSAASAI
jgi:hypothetical protein